MLGVIERCQRAGLDERIDIEWLAHLFQGGNELRRADAVAEPHARQTIDLRKGPHQQQIRFQTPAHQRQQVNRVIEEFDVGFIHHQQDFRRHFVDEHRDVLA